MSCSVPSLYVHVPFCARKCAYCAFYSEASDSQTMDRYVACLLYEIESLPEDFRPQTVFFGGGTPSLLTMTHWRRILEAMERRNYAGAAEFTIECNPATVSLDKAKLLLDFGVNRISMGVQSLDSALLDRLGRIHSRAGVFRSYDDLRKAGFENINLDLMFAIPGQTMVQWQDTLGEALAMAPEHLATYEVIYEEDTPLFKDLQAGKVRQDEDLACDMYETFVTSVAAAGFHQYEVANFARDKEPVSADSEPFYACKHNLNYWRGGQFFGLGPSATAYVSGRRVKNVSNTQRYCEAIEARKPPVDTSEELSPAARAGETAAFGLRMVQGIDFAVFQKTTGFDLRDGWGREMLELEREGLGIIEPGRFRLTPKGLRFADLAAQRFLR